MLPTKLLGLYAYGSLVWGDFDLLAALIDPIAKAEFLAAVREHAAQWPHAVTRRTLALRPRPTRTHSSSSLWRTLIAADNHPAAALKISRTRASRAASLNKRADCAAAPADSRSRRAGSRSASRCLTNASSSSASSTASPSV